MRCILLPMIVAAAALSLASCSTAEEHDPRPVIVHTPLPLDPAQPIEVSRWWSNGVMLLELNNDASYRLYSALNRYQSPREFGRWDRLTYASLQLQPYAPPASAPRRAQLQRDGDAVQLVLPGFSLFKPLEQLPPVTEDLLLGTWRGSQGMLELTSEGQYRFAPSTTSASPMSTHVGHSGTWQVRGGELLLQPTASNLGPFAVQIENADSAERIALITDGQAMQRVTDEMSRSPLTRSEE